MFQAATGVFSVLLITAAGFLAAKSGYITGELEQALVNLAFVTAIPALIFHSTATQISTDFITEKVGWAVLLPAATICAGYALARVLARALRLTPGQSGVMSALFSMSNTILIGLPLCVAVFGDRAAPYAVSYLPSNTVIFWTLGNLGIAQPSQPAGPADPTQSAGRGKTRPGRAAWKQVIRRVFSPPLIAFLAGLAVVLLNISPPDFVMDAARTLGGMATPVALVTVGSVLSRLKRPRITKMMAAALLGRCVFMPLLTFAACSLFGASHEVTVVYTAVSAMPVMNQAVLLARRYDNCVEETAQTFALSALCSLAVIPVIAVALGGI